MLSRLGKENSHNQTNQKFVHCVRDLTCRQTLVRHSYESFHFFFAKDILVKTEIHCFCKFSSANILLQTKIQGMMRIHRHTKCIFLTRKQNTHVLLLGTTRRNTAIVFSAFLHKFGMKMEVEEKRAFSLKSVLACALVSHLSKLLSKQFLFRHVQRNNVTKLKVCLLKIKLK